MNKAYYYIYFVSPSGAQEKAKSPLFVEFVLKNIFTLYETVAVRKDKERLAKIVDSLGVKLTLRDLRHTDPRVQIQAVMSQWLPLSDAVLQMIGESIWSCPISNVDDHVAIIIISVSEFFIHR